MLPDGTYVTACYWGITKQQVSDYFDECRKDPQWDDSDKVKFFVNKFVKPKTDGTGMGVALLFNQDDPRQINVLLSHAWQGNAKRFFEDTLHHLCDQEVAYICFLSNYQGSPEEIEAQLGHMITQAPFTQILQSYTCERLLVVPNEELLKNGQGLYSRLWCDWEIRVAVGEGLPINITSRNKKDYLLGESVSSRHARCGNPSLPINDDEKNIREAIEQNHPENGKFQSIQLLIVAICVAFGPRICVLLYHRKTENYWFLGYLLGFIVGLILWFGVSRPARSLLYRCIHRDGYKVLDSIILQAATHSYEYRRFRPRYDFLVIGLACCFCCIANVIYHSFNEDQLEHREGIAALCMDGITFAGILWPILNINAMGPWTGVFLLRPWARRSWGFVMTFFLLTGALFGNEVLGMSGLRSGRTQGALSGLVVGLSVLSATHQKWYHVAALGFDLIFMIGVYCLMLYHGSRFTMRDSFVAVMGISSLSVAPGMHWTQKLLGGLVGSMLLGGLLVMDVIQADELSWENN